MAWILVFIFSIALIGILLFFMRITVTASLRAHGRSNELKIECKALFGLLTYKTVFTDVELAEDPPAVVFKRKKGAGDEKPRAMHTPEGLLKVLKECKGMLEDILQTQKVLKKFLEAITVRQFEWSTAVGAGDAALTGILAGGIWATKGIIIGFLSEIVKLKANPTINVTPFFQYRVTATMLQCMFTFRAGKAISAGISLYIYLKKSRHKLMNVGLPAPLE
ncbi:DUF2953 domain-containing protein [Bacillus sp. FJAT-27445]|uniref:DUF2953 domain-containing protein n=1 Tax=Bacillus sp. FJAT-27445 TaxID=1679166 RepID=UPI000743711A|nr:DUF2953 domain-containing protein [Bacillus sp. FJAT-27445]